MDTKKLNIAFVWHFHQPNYQQNSNSDFLLPWARLHASKDYLDMLLKIDNFENIKLNFDFSPVLISTLQKYLKGTKDLHLNLLLKQEDDLCEEDKIFILNNYFDLNYKNMVLKRKFYTKLFNKRANAKELATSMFSIQEYFDIMANYTLCWIDEYFIKDYKELKTLFKKEKNYTFDDRKKIYEIQLDIIKRILKEYKKYQDENKIEILTSPYYHAILPLLLNFDSKEIKDTKNLPKNNPFRQDANLQIELAIEKYEEVFEKKPKGIWLSEQCVCQNTLDLLSKYDFKWSVLDEGILSKTTKKEFSRDFEGNLENPYDLTINYSTKGKNSINLLFGDSFFSNLINFGYGNYDPIIAGNDLYEKIKIIQSKLQNSPYDNHILTIALDGENCWETYQNDGETFLNTLYSLIDKDDSLKTVLISDYIQQTKSNTLDNIKPGSWINRNFDLWVGEPVKNLAWLFLSSVSCDIEKYKENELKKIKNEKEKNEFEKKYKKAKKEILIAQGSDWFWWYGEPNKSKNDEIFDFLFRSHLINVYKILNLEIPAYLFEPLENINNNNLRNPKGLICPTLSCDINDENKEWENAGHIFIPDGPTSNISALIKKIYYGKDNDYIYFRFLLNKNSTKIIQEDIQNQISIYFFNKHEKNSSPIRLINKNENFYPILKNYFNFETHFNFNLENVSKLYFSKALNFGLWGQTLSKNSKIIYKDIIELKIPLEDLNYHNNTLYFCIIDSTNELINEIYPQDSLIRI